MQDDTYNSENYIRRVTDIYMAIKDKKIEKKFPLVKANYTLTDKDKIAMAFFIGGFFVNSKIKDILNECPDIDLDRLLAFVNLEPHEINSFANDKDYNVVYENSDIKTIFRELAVILASKYRIIKICPEIICLALGFANFSEANFYNLYRMDCHLKCSTFSTHPLFKKLEDYLIENKFILPLNKKDMEKVKGIPEKVYDNVSSNKYNLNKYDSYLKKDEDLPDPELMPVSFLGKDKSHLWQILDEILKKFIGQEETAENLFYNIVNNQQLASFKEVFDGERSIIFLDGPTGTGKTAITREITEKLNIPFTSTSVVNYSSTGYVGGDITDTLVDLYHKAGDNLSLAERGIIVLDEFDKLSYSKSGGLEMKKAVQQQLLDFLGGGQYQIDVGENIFDKKKISFDTSKLTFICLGALSTLRSEKQERKTKLGFSSEDVKEEEKTYSITPDDLIDMGLERELVGRFNTYLHTNDYSKEDLIKILKTSAISPLIGFKKWLELNNKELVIEEEAYDTIAEYAYNLNTGARSLQTIINNIRTYFMKEVLRGNNQTIHLNAEIVTKINEAAINRKGRG